MIDILAGAALFVCPVVSIHDGDTLTCADRTRVRLAAIDAPEVDGCHGKPGRSCVAGDGFASRDNLASLALRKTIACSKVGMSYRRVVARCSIGGVDLSCAQVRGGFAVERYGRLSWCRR